MRGALLVAVDFGDASRKALDQAIVWSGGRRRELVLCHIVPGGAPSPQAGDNLAAEEGLRLLTVWAEEARAHGVLVATVQRVADPPAKALITVAEENGCSAIVIGTHGRTGLKRAMLGSVAESVVRQSPLPVLVVPATSAPLVLHSAPDAP
ncbi:MAG: universal stress protein [Thermoplasmatota archaeon]